MKNGNKSPHLASIQAGTLTAFPNFIKCFSFLKDFTFIYCVCVGGYMCAVVKEFLTGDDF